MRARAMLVPFALAIAACAPTPAHADTPHARYSAQTSRVCVQSNVPARWGVAAAITQWNHAPETPDMYLSRQCVGEHVTIRFGHLSGGQVGSTWVSTYTDTGDLAGARVIMDPRHLKNYKHKWRACVRSDTSAHELGHVLGLHHYTNSHSGQVMSYLGWQHNCGRVTFADFRDLSNLYRSN